MIRALEVMISDQPARDRALAPDASFIVQAPAGSGKTELLVRRYLRLLTQVDQPESIVAITFTKKAAGEMRARVLQALRSGAPANPDWRLLENPARMRIQTIDSLCALITRQMPWLAGFGAPPDITEKAQHLYREAARWTLQMVAEEERAGEIGPLSTLLLHLDLNFNNAESLIAGMLEKRDQWLRHTGVNPDLAQIRAELEDALDRLVTHELTAVREALPSDAVRDILMLLDLDELPTDLPGWTQVADLLLTKSGDPRKKAPPEAPRERWNRLMSRLCTEHELLARLKEVRRLPPTRFDDAQWQTMEALVDVLPKAVANLQLVFRDRSVVDFAELSIRALEALGPVDSPTDLALSLGNRIEHLLVDEFQDTSYTQYELLRRLTAGCHTLFLVGDPMQSIYRFREADVSLFLKAQREGIGQIALEPLTLTSNFRSTPAIIDWVNQTFAPIFENNVPYTFSKPGSADDRFAPSANPPVFHPTDDPAQILALLRESPGSKAILVRSRTHLIPILRALRDHRIPFQAIEIDALADRPLIQDLLALTHALLHLADRVAWLTILRAPWCGLTLPDLDAIAATGHASTIWDLIHRKDLALSPDGRQRLNRCLPHLRNALDQRGRVPLRTLVEQTWLHLGGPASAQTAADMADVEAYFNLLESLDQTPELLRDQIADLFAQPDTAAGPSLQIMTIHKAKGLEFDTVILPGLGQRPRTEDTRLLLWQEQQGELLLAPMSRTGEDVDPIYRYLTHLDHEKGRQEAARLLYVATTRARHTLHLMGTPAESGTPAAGSFLKLLWPAVAGHFEATSAPALATAAATKPVRQLTRLTATWTLPARPPFVTGKAEALDDAAAPEVTYEWVGDTLRHVGTVLHTFLQRIAAGGHRDWDRETYAAMLANLGVPPTELPEAVTRVQKALTQMLAGERGQWILAPHAEAASEFQITGLVDGKLYQARIDRTFIDEQGTRWIIDYKTSTHEGGSLENFLETERQRYEPAMERYARLMAQREDRPIRLALYFPLLDAWKEWAAPTIKRRQASLFD